LNFTSFDNIGLVKVLTFLKAHDKEYLSGQDLSDILKISRVAVWKHIKKIRSLGYNIDSKQKLGYRLVGNTDLLLPWEIQDRLNTKYIGSRVYYFDSIDSTQMFASKISNDDEGTVVISKKQTDGKGRLGRKWVSPSGGIWCSIVFHPKFDASSSTLFPLIAGIAIANTIEKFYKLSPKLKWPNDVTINGRKVAGIIVDASMESNKISNIILGIGINFTVDVNSIEKSQKGVSNFYGAFSRSDESVSRIKFTQTLFQEMEKEYEKLSDCKIS
jgi:BirA family transcriptional regulator, biotin operon repressor / biotin---[acetyl-CoA-carboxylase] ligase